MRKITFLLATTIFYLFIGCTQEIPIEYLSMDLDQNSIQSNRIVLPNEIPGIEVEHVALIGDESKIETQEMGFKNIFLFIKGQGIAEAGNERFNLVPESILLPNNLNSISINVSKNDTLHYLKISSALTEQDLLDLKEFPKENTERVYFKAFIDCESYTEPIKSPKTVSRTVLPNQIIPRIAMETVETLGPDKVQAHEHPMLEQLFLGLTNNEVTVFADDAKIDFPAYSVLHIPLGSSHSVEVGDNKKMYYMWMDFFKDKKGEEWLKTHNTVEEE
ncbi:MAG: hypothetical protein JXR07_06395 [Reichenbachiella sp.]